MSRRAFVGCLGAGAYLALARAYGPRRSVAGQNQPLFVASRDAWHAVPPRGMMLPHVIDRVTLHHTGPPAWHGRPPSPEYLRIIQAFHMGPERRWPDIAYHLLVDLDGVIWEGRSLKFAGDTATDYDPTGHALVAVLGDYDVQRPAPAQVESVANAVRRLLDRYGLGTGVVGGHRDYAATACPGRHLYSLLEEIRATV